MKKQKQTTISPTALPAMVNNHRQKAVAPPPQAGRGMDGKYAISKAQAAQFWFKAAKEQNPSGGFLDVPSETLDPKAATDNEMLIKGKKSKE